MPHAEMRLAVMRACLLLAALLALAACGGPAPRPPSPEELDLDPRYRTAFEALATHPAVQAFAAAHLPPTEMLALEVAPEVVPLDYAALAGAVLRHEGGPPARLGAVRDSLAALAAADGLEPGRQEALAALSRGQHRPLVLFFGRPGPGRLGAQLFPNPYRRAGFEAVRRGAPGLALLVVFDERGAIEHIHAAEMEDG